MTLRKRNLTCLEANKMSFYFSIIGLNRKSKRLNSMAQWHRCGMMQKTLCSSVGFCLRWIKHLNYSTWPFLAGNSSFFTKFSPSSTYDNVEQPKQTLFLASNEKGKYSFINKKPDVLNFSTKIKFGTISKRKNSVKNIFTGPEFQEITQKKFGVNHKNRTIKDKVILYKV